MPTDQIEIIALPPVRVGNILGEGIVWDDVAQAFLWTDIKERMLYRLSWPSRELHSHALPYRLGSMALTNRPGTIIAAFEQGFARYDYTSGALKWLARPEQPAGVRFNDGRVDRSGRFVAGTMVEDAAAAGGPRLGKLYRLEEDNSLTILVDGIGITNALCWSPDGGTMHHTDSTTGIVNRYRYPTPDDTCEPFLTYEGTAPDGATIDAESRFWVALWGGSRVECRASDGRLVATIRLPVSQPTCLAFGGTNFDILAVTTASEDVEENGAGDLFLFQTSAHGLPENRLII